MGGSDLNKINKDQEMANLVDGGQGVANQSPCRGG